MRRFSRALTQRYVGAGEDFSPTEEDALEWDDTAESSDQPTMPRAVARPAMSVDDAIRAAERPTASSRPKPRPAAPQPAPPRPVSPLQAAAPQPVNPAPQPIAQRAPDSGPAAQPTPPPMPSAPPQPAAAQPSGIEWPEGVPRTWNGSPIPISNTPTPPALKAWIQRERDREVRRKEILAERKDQLLSQLLPQPEDPNAPRNTRLRPRGHAEVDYINTDSLRKGDDAHPLQRNFDTPAGDSGTSSPSTPREPSQPAGERAANDDDETSTPAPLIAGDDYNAALDAAIQRAESFSEPSQTDFDAAPVTSDAPRMTPQADTPRQDKPPAASFDVPASAPISTGSTGNIQRTAESPAPAAPSNIQRVESPAPPVDIPDPSELAVEDMPEDDFGGWDADDMPDMPETEASEFFESPVQAPIQRQADDSDFYAEPDVYSESDNEAPAAFDSDAPAPFAPSAPSDIQRAAAREAAIQRAESINPVSSSDNAPDAPPPRSSSKRAAKPVSESEVNAPAPSVRPIPTITPVQRSADAAPQPESDIPAPTITPVQRSAEDFAPQSSAPSDSVVQQPTRPSGGNNPAGIVTPQAAIDAAIQRAESVTPPDMPAPRKPSRRSAEPTPQSATPPDFEAAPDIPVQRTADGQASQSPAAPSVQPNQYEDVAPLDSQPNRPESPPVQPIQRQAALDAAIQRAESPSFDSTPSQPQSRPQPEAGDIARPAPDTPIQPIQRTSSDSTPSQPQSRPQLAAGDIARPAPDTPIQPIQRTSSDTGATRQTPAQTQPDDSTAPQPSDSAPQSEGFSALDISPLQRQSLVDAAIQRAESPAQVFEQPRFDRQSTVTQRQTDQFGGAAPEAASYNDDDAGMDAPDFAQSPVSDDGYTDSPSTPIQRTAAEYFAQSPAFDDGYTDSPSTPIQRTAAEYSVPPSEDWDVSSQTMPDGDFDPSPDNYDSAPSVQTPQSAIDAAIQRAESVNFTPSAAPQTPTSSPQPFVPSTRTPEGVTQPSRTDSSTPAIQRSAPLDPQSGGEVSVQRSALEAAIQRAESVTPSAPPKPQPFAPRTRKARDEALQSSETADVSAPIMRRTSDTAPIQRAQDTAAPTPETLSRSTAASVSGQPVAAQSTTPANLASAPVQRAALDAAIQRAEAIPVTGATPARPFVPTTRKSSAPAAPATSSGIASGAGGFPVPVQPSAYTQTDAIQRDVDDFESWALPDGYENAAPESERPDVFQAMMAAGMVSPTTPAPIQRTADYAAAKEAAVSRAEASTPRPDILQAMRAAGMVSDANAAATVQRAANPDEPQIARTVPVNTPLQRALGDENYEQPEIPEGGSNVQQNVNVEQLAHDVYRVLREKMRIEAERRPK